MSSVRNPILAGTFYPADKVSLVDGIRKYFANASAVPVRTDILMAPHAGHVYSGPIAANAYRCWEADADHIHRVVLIGPSHRVAFRGLALPSHAQFLTPLGAVCVDQQAGQKLLQLPQVFTDDRPHAAEHSLEVHLPFLQHMLVKFEVLPIVAGDASAEDVCAVIEECAQWENTRILISTDLSHFHPYDEAVRIDRNTTSRIEEKSADLNGQEACGHVPVNGALLFARRNRLNVSTLDVRNSGDTAGRNMRDRVVGYGAYAVH